MNILFLYLRGLLFPYKTKAERKELYKEMLVYIEEPHSNTGFCLALFRATREKWIGRLWQLPELYKYRPFVWWDGRYDLWYDIDDCGMNTRKIILRHIIKQL